MCGRTAHQFTWKELHDLLEFGIPPKSWPAALTPSYNVAPTQLAPIVRLDEEDRRVPTLARWGLVPSWADDVKIGSRMINARAETVVAKPAFRSAFRSRRCIVPVSGFYEWQAIEGEKTKQPWYIYRADGQILCFAGLWETWSKGDAPLTTFTIVTTSANEAMRPVHDRMPVVLEPEQCDAWLEPAAPVDKLEAMLLPAADAVLARHEVSTRVNTPRNNDATLVDAQRGP